MAVDNLKIVYKSPASLSAYARNTRTHSPEQIDLIARSMVEVGFTNPVLLKDDGKTIGAGHARVLAAIKIGLTRVPTVTLNGLTEEQWRAYVIMDNQLAVTGAGWDIDILKLEIGDLNGVGFDLGLLGFDDKFLDSLLAETNAGTGDPDEAPPAPAEPLSRLGDVWLLGKHRLVCGDSTTVEAVDKALNGVSPDLMVTDPPYGVKVHQDDRKNKRLEAADGSKRASGTVMNDDRADWREAWTLFPGNVAYVWHAGMTRFEVEGSLRVADFDIRAEIIWRKSKPTLRAGNISQHSMGYSWQHECCLYAVKKGGRVDWTGDKAQTTVWDIDHAKSETGHGTQKPVEAMLRPIQNNSSPGQAVYDPFVGSGTTIIAAEMSGRTCLALELDPTYVDVSVLRWQTFTGSTATLEATGQTFSEVLAERQPNRPIVAAETPKKARKK